MKSMRTIKFRAWSKTAKVMHPVWAKLSDEDGENVCIKRQKGLNL